MDNLDVMKGWLEEFVTKVRGEFEENVFFIGIQGSYARGEAKDESDIDMVVIFKEFDGNILLRYAHLLESMPKAESICGFTAGRRQLENWDRADLMGLCLDTHPLYGDISYLREKLEASDIRRAVHLGACNIYHACVHNALHKKSSEALKEILKAAFFVIRTRHYLTTKEYIPSAIGLKKVAKGIEGEIMSAFTGQDSWVAEELESKILLWAGDIINNEDEGGEEYV